VVRREQLTDEQWGIMEPLIRATVHHADGRGRLQLHSNRAVINGILWVLCTGAAWADLPDRFSSKCTCFSRFTRWVKSGVMRQILESLALHLSRYAKVF